METQHISPAAESTGIRGLAHKAIRAFSPTEYVLFILFLAGAFISALLLLGSVNQAFMVSVPERGGSFTEGIIGTPRFINPLLAISDADKDMSALLYSGLLKATPDGHLIPDLAQGFSVSEDGLLYTVTLKEGVSFHDGTPVTADDVEFTIQMVQDSALKSPRRGNWEGVTVEKVDSREIRFILRQPYAPFLENLTLGILPKHIWNNASVDEFSFSALNVSPIGSGPYQIDTIRRNSAQIPTEYHLRSFEKYALGEPYIHNITVRFFPDEVALIKAYQEKTIDSASGISAETTRTLEIGGSRVEKAVLPRIFGVFFNQNQAQIFANKAVREALDVGLDKKRIVDEVLFGYGKVLHGPMPVNWLFDIDANSTNHIILSEEERIQKAQGILEEDGWVKNETSGIYEKGDLRLAFTIATGDAPELKRAATIIQEEWQKIGGDITLAIFETGDLNQNIIRPRRYDALFFGEVIGRDLDLYAFWHSSQRNDPGLNIASYANITVDSLLEEARTTTDETIRKERYQAIQEEIQNEIPAVFTYSPTLLYLAPQKISNIELEHITVANERFLNIHEWHSETSNVWRIFTN